MTPRLQERGATAVVVAILVVAIGGMMALSLNVGHFMSVRNQLQNATDAGALAGAKSLNGTVAKLTEARNMAQDFTERHKTDRQVLEIDLNASNDPGGDVVLGRWVEATASFEMVPNPVATPGQVNAVLVRAGRESARGNALDVFFSAFLSQDEASVTAEAIGVGGGPCTECVVPLVFADCLIVQEDDSLACGEELVFTSATVDNIGFTNLIPGDGSVNTPGIIDVFNNNCGGGVGVGDSIGIGNGNNLNNNVIAAMQAYIERNGTTMKAPIVHPASCPDPQFNQLQPVVGFATFTVLEIQGAPNRMLRIALDCEPIVEEPQPGGCTFFGTPGQVRLVR